jgi:hypothetical protein
MPRFLESAGFFLSLPERTIRALAASLGGTVYEATEILLPSWLRGSRLPADDMDMQEFTLRKAAGTGIEMAGFLTIGWSPIWLFAVVADLSGGTRAYLQELVSELKGDGMLLEDADISSIEELLDALEGGSGIMAESLDTPPLNVEDMRSSWNEMQQHKNDLPDASRLTSLYNELQATAEQQDHSVQYMSSLIATGALRAGVNLGQVHIFDYYQDSLRTINREGLPFYSRRVIKPYFAAAKNHFNPQQLTFTERLLGRRHKILDGSVIE